MRKDEDEKPSVPQEIQRTVFMAVKTPPVKAPSPQVCCFACGKVCEEVLWSADEDSSHGPRPTCGRPCLLSYYSKKGLIDGIDLEGLTEEMSIKKIEDIIFLDRDAARKRDVASASSGEFEVIEDATGRMQQREQEAEVIKARQNMSQK